MKGHIKAVHRDGGFDMKTWIQCGLRSTYLNTRNDCRCKGKEGVYSQRILL